MTADRHLPVNLSGARPEWFSALVISRRRHSFAAPAECSLSGRDSSGFPHLRSGLRVQSSSRMQRTNRLSPRRRRVERATRAGESTSRRRLPSRNRWPIAAGVGHDHWRRHRRWGDPRDAPPWGLPTKGVVHRRRVCAAGDGVDRREGTLRAESGAGWRTIPEPPARFAILRSSLRGPGPRD